MQINLLALVCACTILLPAGIATTADWTVSNGQTASKPVGLRCEYLLQPPAIGVARPRLSWFVTSSSRGAVQTAYQVLVASSPELLARDQGNLWDSGRVASAQNIHVEYAGQTLRSNMQCHWKVRIWDGKGIPSNWSEPAVWSMGLLKPEDWRASWIAASDRDAPPGPVMLRKEIIIPSGLKRAVVHVCGLGHYELYLNGRRVGDRVLDPAWTNYRKSCHYASYEVADMLQPGPNVFAVVMGNGMYNVTGGRYAKFTGSFGPPKLILQTDLELSDGTTAQVLTDDSWKCADGPITFSCIFGGEDYDARRERDGWMQPGYDDSAWSAVAIVDGPGGRLVPQQSPPIKVMQILKPTAVTEPRPGVLVYNLGQNISGWPKITVRGPAGATVKILPEELLDADGMVTQRFGPTWYSYILKGAGEESWHPQFSYYGFQYLQVEGAARESQETDQRPVLLNIEGQWVYGSAAPIGEFSCSNPLLNRIERFVDAAVRSNMQSIFTDCPHREKLGWLSVASSMAISRMYGYDVPTLYAKVLDDMREAQTPEGLIPNIAPEYVVFQDAFRESPTWGSDYILVPWLMYQHYGDRRVLEDHYPTMVRYMEYLATTARDHILSYGLADWADVGPNYPWSHTPISLVETAQYFCNAKTMERVAQTLGRTEDAERFARLATEINTSYNKTFFHPQKNVYGEGTQTANAMPLVLGMVADDCRPAVLENLVRDIRRQGNAITSGCVGHRWLLRALADNGQSDLICDTLLQTTQPGYAFQLNKGATALTESWDARRNISWNHDMLGQIIEWFYHDLAGIQIDLSRNGPERLVIKPAVIGDLTWVRANHNSMFGRIKSNWSRQDRKLVMEVTVPGNITALVHVPAADQARVYEGGKPAIEAEGVRFVRHEGFADVFDVASGDYRFETELPH